MFGFLSVLYGFYAVSSAIGIIKTMTAVPDREPTQLSLHQCSKSNSFFTCQGRSRRLFYDTNVSCSKKFKNCHKDPNEKHIKSWLHVLCSNRAFTEIHETNDSRPKFSQRSQVSNFTLQTYAQKQIGSTFKSGSTYYFCTLTCHNN